MCVPMLTPALRRVSGTYKSPSPSGQGWILELRVDVDGRRPQARVSGDFFYRYSIWGFTFVLYSHSIVIESLAASNVSNEMVLTGPVVYYADASKVNDSIEVRIPRVSVFATPADATAKFYTSGTLNATYLCPKVSEHFRTVTLEVDMLQGTAFPPTVNTHITPHPADLANENVTTALIYDRAGIDMTVDHDDVLNDPDGSDPGSTWSWGELHDLMENRFDLFADSLQWNVYGVVVPEFEAAARGAMFDWGGWQAGDTYLRQGAAIAYDTILDTTVGTLYDTDVEMDRLLLKIFCHEVGHAFNLPHPWARTANPDSASTSFMNYNHLYTGGGGATSLQRETDFWSDFRWEFDDVELIWMRHQDRNAVIFGGTDWIGDNLSVYTEPEFERRDAPLTLEVRAPTVLDFAEPVRVEIELKNVSDAAQVVTSLLEPEDGMVTLYIRRPNGDRVRYIPPIRRDCGPSEVTLAPGEAIYETVLMSYGARGAQFREPGEYRIRAYYTCATAGMIVSPGCRLRVAYPSTRDEEALAHLLFGHEAAKFLYLGGTERYPATTSRLQEAVTKYAKTAPSVVRHVHAALGRHASHPFKRIIRKEGRRVIGVRGADLKQAVTHLEAARKPLSSKVSALDNITYNQLSVLLADCYRQQEKSTEALRVLRESQRYLKRRRVDRSVLNAYQRRIEALEEQSK
jgi:hypothetical protein